MDREPSFGGEAIPEPDPIVRGFAEKGDARLLFQLRAPLLGELAQEAGLIDRHRLTEILAQQRRDGGRLGDILIGAGLARHRDIARLVATQRRIRCLNLRLEPPDPALADPDKLDFYIENRCLPWRHMGNETIYAAADPDKALRAISARLGHVHPVFVASARDIDIFLRQRFAVEIDARARLDLVRLHPESSAKQRLTSAQSMVLGVLCFLLLGLLILAPAQTLIGLNIFFGIFFVSIAGLRGLSVLGGLFIPPTMEERAYEQAENRIADRELPVYSVLIPLLREAEILPLLASALTKLDYPASKLDIKFIIEEMDRETYEAAKALDLPHNFEFIRVPPSLPLTKPKACNYALPFARGEYLVLYDAEDMPEPDQLKRAAAAFRQGDDRLACVQAHLNYYNWHENWLTKQFALEYAALFDLLLPTLSRLGMPIPLGGTSTHFRTSLLRQAGGWDPYNVTEDADLGMRFALLGLRTGIIRSTTHEEAVCEFENWMRQRSRWVKGWIQTYLVRMRHPVKLCRSLGFRGFVGFQLVLGGVALSGLIHPLFYLYMGAAMISGVSLTGPGTSFLIVIFNLIVLVSGYSMAILAGMVAASARGMRPLVLHALMMPAYWILISIGAYRAMFQFVVKPFHWEKTKHGISRLTRLRLKNVRKPPEPDIEAMSEQAATERTDPS